MAISNQFKGSDGDTGGNLDGHCLNIRIFQYASSNSNKENLEQTLATFSNRYLGSKCEKIAVKIWKKNEGNGFFIEEMFEQGYLFSN